MSATRSLANGMHECHTGITRAIYALAKDGKRDTEVFNELCELSEAIESFINSLQPSIVFEGFASIVRPKAGVTTDISS